MSTAIDLKGGEGGKGHATEYSSGKPEKKSRPVAKKTFSTTHPKV